MSESISTNPLRTILTNKQYDLAKWATTYVLPAAALFYFSIAGIWGLPGAEPVLGTGAALETFLGVILGISTRQWNKLPDGGASIDGVMHISPEGEVYAAVETPTEDVVNKGTIILKVQDNRQ